MSGLVQLRCVECGQKMIGLKTKKYCYDCIDIRNERLKNKKKKVKGK